MSWLPLGLDFDGGIPQQRRLVEQLRHVAELRAHERDLRLWASRAQAAKVRRAIEQLRAAHPGPWLTFYGSGDFNHVSLLLLETLPRDAQPVTLVLIDHHPDWFTLPPRYHCGNWVAGALRLPWVESAVLIGQGSADLRGHSFWVVPFRELCEGDVQVFPSTTARVRVPLRWPAAVRGAAGSTRRWYGTELRFPTVEQQGAAAVFDAVAARLAGQQVYVCLDKDCLAAPYAATDWDQGRLTLQEVLSGIERLQQTTKLVGMDVCGDAAPSPLRGVLKRLDAGRLFSRPARHADWLRINQETNLAILRSVTTDVVASR